MSCQHLDCEDFSLRIHVMNYFQVQGSHRDVLKIVRSLCDLLVVIKKNQEILKGIAGIENSVGFSIPAI
jgi:hypothetical protein